MSRQNRIGIKTLFGMAIFGLLWTSPLPAQTPCTAEIEFTNPKPPVSDKIDLNIFSTTGKGCLPAEIRLMAAFYDSQLNIVCSGVIESIAVQNANVQSTNIEVRPRNLVEFARLRTPTNVPPKRLFCLNPETDTEINPSEMARAASLRLRATILPKSGGVATTEIRIAF